MHQKAPPTRMYLSLDTDVAFAVSEHNITPPPFNSTNTNIGTSKRYKTNITGSFRCYNPSCLQRRWASYRIGILIRRYTNGSYNAEVAAQRCKSCRRLGKMYVDKDCYVERVSYRLLARAGVRQEQPEYEVRRTPPHEKRLCEGCKRGICRESGV